MSYPVKIKEVLNKHGHYAWTNYWFHVDKIIVHWKFSAVTLSLIKVCNTPKQNRIWLHAQWYTKMHPDNIYLLECMIDINLKVLQQFKRLVIFIQKTDDSKPILQGFGNLLSILVRIKMILPGTINLQHTIHSNCWTILSVFNLIFIWGNFFSVTQKFWL